MKFFKRILFASILLINLSGNTQESTNILQAPKKWLKETIPFPISFAPTIDYRGFEYLRFAPKWSDPSAKSFWTYTFVWRIEKDTALTISNLSRMINVYYDGLMSIDIVRKSDTVTIQKTQNELLKTPNGFRGEILVYDNFFTKKMMTLFVKVSESFCDSSNKQFILFQLSSKHFDHKTWKMFEKVKLMIDCS